MNDQEIIQKIQKIKQIRLEDRRKDELWQQIVSRTFDRPETRNRWLARTALVGSLALLILFASGGVLVASAQDALPGDQLYQVKLAGEKVRLIATKSAKRAELKATYTERRVKEYEELIEREDGEDRLTKNQQRALTEISTSITNLRIEPTRIHDKEDLGEFIQLLEDRKATIKDLGSRTTGVKRQNLMIIEDELNLILRKAQETYEKL